MELDALLPESVAYPTPDHPDGLAASMLPAGGGIYLLTDREDRFIQLASAGDLRRALGHRLGGAASQEAPSGKRADLREIVRRIRWRRAYSMFEITWEYYRLARLLMPHEYIRQVGFGPSWFVHVDPAAEFPRFQVGKWIKSPPGVDLGPLATQADAARLVEILEDAFDLCRYHHVLVQAPRGQPCAYLDMGKCPAPCDGRVSMATYREMIGSALAFATGERRPVFERWEAAMRKAASEREFERAGAIKQTMERAARIEHDSLRLVQPTGSFRYLIVQRGPGSTQVKPFFMRGGLLEAGSAVRIRDLEAVVPAWLGKVQPTGAGTDPAGEVDPVVRSEQIWLVSHFLFRNSPPGLFLSATEPIDAADLVGRIRADFAVRKREKSLDQTACDAPELLRPAGDHPSPGGP